MDLDKWVVGRTEQVVYNALELLDFPSDGILWVMTCAMEGHPGMLRHISTFDFFESFEVEIDALEEAIERIEEFDLSRVDPTQVIVSVADETLTYWCMYFVEFVGVLSIAKDKEGGLSDLSGLIVVEESEEDDPSEADTPL